MLKDITDSPTVKRRKKEKKGEVVYIWVIYRRNAPQIIFQLPVYESNHECTNKILL